MSFNQQIVLFVIPDGELRHELVEALQHYENPYPYQVVATIREARSVLEDGIVRCIVMTKPIALIGDGDNPGLIAMLPGLLPTITLLYHGDGFPDYLYSPGEFHDWCTLPFSLDELYGRLSRLLERAEK